MRTNGSNGHHDFSTLNRYDLTLSHTRDDVNLFFVAADNQINNTSQSSSFHAQSCYCFGKIFCVAYCDLHDSTVERVSEPPVTRSRFPSMSFSILSGKRRELTCCRSSPPSISTSTWSAFFSYTQVTGAFITRGIGPAFQHNSIMLLHYSFRSQAFLSRPAKPPPILIQRSKRRLCVPVDILPMKKKIHKTAIERRLSGSPRDQPPLSFRGLAVSFPQIIKRGMAVTCTQTVQR